MPGLDARVAVVVVAAGSGERLGHARPKAFVDVAGRSILERALSTAFALPEPAQIIVVAPAAYLDEARRIALGVAGVAADYVDVVPGGDTRQRSVAEGLALAAESVEVVLVHDAARALTPVAQFERVIDAVRATGDGVIPGLAVADTIKQVDAAGAVLRTVDRSELVAVQTPQGFPRRELQAAYAADAEDFTDDAALYSATVGAVTAVAGDPLAFKITTPWDLRRAESLVAASEAGAARAASEAVALPAETRVGLGIDVHAFDDGQPLWLGGVLWPDEPGLAGHSDGDAVSHAVCDALLSAVGLGDLGSRFGTSDPRFAGARGSVFLAETVALVHGAGFRIVNVAVQVVGQRPRMSTRRAEIEQVLSAAVGAPVSVSATTSDHLGFTGRREGLAALATALVARTTAP